MLRWGLIAAVALLCGWAGVARADEPQSTPVVIGQTWTLDSAVLRMPRKISIYLPPSYAGGENRYPVLYLVDGGEQQDFHHISGLAQLATISGATQEFIVVGIETTDRTNELTYPATDPRYVKKWPTLGGAPAFRRFIAQEVQPFVDDRYRTSGETALMGESLAGLFVVDTFLRQPGLVDRYVAVSPSLWWDSGSLATQAPALLAAQDGADRTLWLTIADEGGSMQTATDRLVAALKAAPPKGLKWSYAARPTETHASIYHGAALDALRSLWGLDTHYGDGSTPWWLEDAPEAAK